MENYQTPISEANKPFMGPSGINHLTEARKWTMFLSVLGFIFIAIMLLTPLAFLSVQTPMAVYSTTASFIGVILIALIYFFPIYYLFQFSRYSKKAIHNNDDQNFSEAIKYLKRHFRFIGVLAIIGIVFYVLAIIAFIVGGSLIEPMY